MKSECSSRIVQLNQQTCTSKMELTMELHVNKETFMNV